MNSNQDSNNNNTLTNKYVDDHFFTKKDVIELKKHNVIDKDIKLFFTEMRNHFNRVWTKEYTIKDDIESFEKLNTIIGDYPSHGGYEIINNAFTCVDHCLSDKSTALLGYFYNIHLG